MGNKRAGPSCAKRHQLNHKSIVKDSLSQVRVKSNVPIYVFFADKNMRGAFAMQKPLIFYSAKFFGEFTHYTF